MNTTLFYSDILVIKSYESALNLLAGVELRKLFENTRLKSSDVGPSVAHSATSHSPPPPLLCYIPTIPLSL